MVGDIKLSLGQVETYKTETNQQLELVQQLGDKKAEMIKKTAEFEAVLLKRKLAIIEKKNSIPHLKLVLQHIAECAQSIDKNSQHLDEFAKKEKENRSESSEVGSGLPTEVEDLPKMEAQIAAFASIVNKLDVALNCKEFSFTSLSNIKENKKKLEEETKVLESHYQNLLVFTSIFFFFALKIIGILERSKRKKLKKKKQTRMQ